MPRVIVQLSVIVLPLARIIGGCSYEGKVVLQATRLIIHWFTDIKVKRFHSGIGTKTKTVQENGMSVYHCWD